MELDPAQGWPLQATLQGERFEVADLAQAHVLASPELTVAVARKAIDVGGTLRIPTATVTLQELPARAVRVSDDLVIVDAPKAATPGSALPEPPGWRIESRIKVMLGDKVRFRGFGISTRLTGSVLVTDLPGQMTVGEGVVNIAEGEYRAYGQELKITQGRILFAGPITNPALQIEVAREVDDVTAGIRVTGTPRAPQVAVFSKPAMAETDALAYLLLGSPMRELSGAEGKLLLNAVSTLGLAGGEFLAQRIGQTLGLQDVEVKTGNTLEEASLLVGRYLSPRLYIGYGLGLFDQSNTFRVRYKINRRLTLQAETGAQQGADLLYTIEF
jgi:translocation and assembly module TamB